VGFRKQLYYCDFCQKTQKEVAKMVSNGEDNKRAICNECTDLACEIMIDEGIDLAAFKKVPKVDLEAFSLVPKDIIEMMHFRPIFNSKQSKVVRNSCFYLGPFREPYNTIYNDHVVPALVRRRFKIARADEIFSTDAVIEDVWAGINSAFFIIADVTGRNPNVMYEIGMAHTVGKPVLLISQSADDIPFDLRHRRCLVYEYTPRGCQKLEEGIAQTIAFLRHEKRSAK